MVMSISKLCQEPRVYRGTLLVKILACKSHAFTQLLTELIRPEIDFPINTEHLRC